MPRNVTKKLLKVLSREYIYIYIYTYIHIYIYTYIHINIYTANCINLGKHKHTKEKTCIGESVTVNTLINLSALDWPSNVPKNTYHIFTDR